MSSDQARIVLSMLTTMDHESLVAIHSRVRYLLGEKLNPKIRHYAYPMRDERMGLACLGEAQPTWAWTSDPDHVTCPKCLAVLSMTSTDATEDLTRRIDQGRYLVKRAKLNKQKDWAAAYAKQYRYAKSKGYKPHEDQTLQAWLEKNQPPPPEPPKDPL